MQKTATLWAFRVVLAAGLLAGLQFWLLAPAEALPSFARQTGQPCTTCHAGFPELTPYGRMFKLRGYSDSIWDSNYPEQPPVAVMIQPQFTHTEGTQTPGTNPRFKANNDFTMQSGSIFYGGKIAYTAGAFVQTTWNNGGTSNRYFLDTSDLRYANENTAFNQDFVWGLDVNNAPTIEDVWNTTPNWSYPFAASNLAPTPSATTLVEGGLNSKVAGGGAYALWNDLIYADVTLYRPLSPEAQTTIGISPYQQDRAQGTIPYWRVALQPSWNEHAFEVGTFGMQESRYPTGLETSGTDHITDVGFDAQYQYLGDVNYVSFMTSWIHESQNRDASYNLGLSARNRDTLQRFKAKASYIYDNTYEGTVGYFNTSGSTDATLYSTNNAAGSPAAAGYNFQLDYLIMKHSMMGNVWPWAGGRISLMYTMYTKFNGAGRNYDGNGRSAWDNNTLFLVAWLAF
jgi:hypothetical protein